MKSIDIFPWNENFNTGVPKIDEQHKVLVQLLNRLASHVAFNSDIPALNEIFDELADYAVYHFQTEEAIWHEYLAEDATEAQHKLVHASFVETVLKLKNEEKHKPTEKLVEEVLAFLTRWLAAHILENDRYMAMVVLAIQSGMSLESAKQHASEQMRGATRALIDIILSIYDSLSSNTLHLMRELAGHKRDQDELSKLKLAVEQSPNSILITDLDENIEYINETFLKITGFTRDEVIGKNPRFMRSGKTPRAAIDEMKSALARGESWKGEFINHRKNGEEYIESTWISPVKQTDGSITHYLAIKEDITESKHSVAQMQMLLREQKAMLESDLIGIAKAKNRAIAWNNSTYEKLFGYNKGELVGESTRAIYTSQEAYEALGAAAYPVLQSGNIYRSEMEFVRKDGSLVWMDLSGVMLDASTGESLWSFADITDRKLAEDNLKKSLNLLRSVIDTSPVRVFWKDRDSRYLGCNELFARDSGFSSPEQLIGKSDFDMGWKDQAELYRADDKQVMESGLSKLSFDEPQTAPDGKQIWLRTSKVPLRNENDGEATGVLGIYEDITDRKHAEELLKKEKQFSDDVIDNLPGIFYVLNSQGTFVRVNPKFLEVSGYQAEELYRISATSLFEGQYKEIIAEAIRTTFEMGDGSVEAELTTKFGQRIPYFFSGHLTIIEGQPYLVGLGTDITESKRFESQLEKSESRLRAIIESEPECIKIVDTEGRLVEMNPAGLAMLEADSLEQVAGNPVVNVIAPEFREAFTSMHKRVIGGEPMTLEFQVIGLHGGRRWLETHAVPMQEANGKIVHLAVTKDISVRKQAEEQIQALLREQKAMLETDLVGIVKVKDRLTTWANPAFEKMLGYEHEELVGQPTRMHYINEESYIALGVAAYPILNSGNIYRTRIEHRRKNGDVIWLDMSGTLLDNTNGESLWAFIDVTDQINAQVAIREAKDLAENIARIRSEFLANMSHEIRTPMNGIIGLSQLALNQPTSPTVRDYLQKISSSSQSLLGILNDILDFSKMEAGRMSIENGPFDLDQIVDNLRNLFEERAEAKHIDFEIEIAEGTPRDLVGDAMRVQQILSNLIGNAIKFTSQGHVALKVRVKQLEGSHVQLIFSVEDTGIGIAKDDLSKLFKPFSQVDGSITRRFGGTGLGLAISYQLLQLLGGEFNVTSQNGQGTTFSFDLLLGIAAHKGVRETRHRNKREAGDLEHELKQQGDFLRGVRILVAEDNSINQQVVKEFLKLSGMLVTIANNGQEALDLLKQQIFDAILMDVHMPVMGGIEATRHIRGEAIYNHLPIIALTAGVTQEERDNCIAIGMNDFIAKPVNPESLITTLAKWVKPTLPTEKTSPPTAQDEWDEIAIALPDFDFSTLKTMIGAKSALLLDMLHSFLRDFSGESSVIVSNLQKNEIAVAEKLIHRLKGTAGSLGAKALHQACEILDAQLKQGNYSQDSLNTWLKVHDSTMATLADMLTKWKEKS